jgi:micrococcal nuclease
MNPLLVLLILITSVAYGKSGLNKIQGTIIKCHDGDTCTIKTEDKKFNVRFSGIDSPEIKQAYGKQARDFTANLIKDKEVTLECDGKSFDRTTCTVFLNETNINAEIVKAGFAFDVPRYSNGKYRDFMLEAKTKRIGIWKDNPVSPFCFRKKKNKVCKKDPLFMGN